MVSNKLRHLFSGIWELTTVGFVVNATAVEDEGAMRGVDADGHRPVFEQRHLEGVGVARRDVGVALDLSEQLGVVQMAESILWGEEVGKG